MATSASFGWQASYLVDSAKVVRRSAQRVGGLLRLDFLRRPARLHNVSKVLQGSARLRGSVRLFEEPDRRIERQPSLAPYPASSGWQAAGVRCM